MKQAIVIGALGFVGYRLCCRLLDKDVRVIGVDFSPKEESVEEEKLFQIGRNADFTFINLDIENLWISSDLVKCNNVFYSLVDPTCSIETSEMDKQREITKKQIVKVIEFCKKNNSRFILISTANKKLHHFQEKMIRNQQKQDDFDYMIIRVPTLFGPWQPNNMYYQQAILAKLENRDLQLSIEESSNDILYIDDAIDGILLIGTSINKDAKKNYQLSSGLNEPWHKGLDLILNKTSTERIGDYQINMDDKFTIITCKQSISLKEGIANQIEYAKWFKKRFGE
jgi:UDP-glucose 4-epimerase